MNQKNDQTNYYGQAYKATWDQVIGIINKDVKFFECKKTKALFNEKNEEVWKIIYEYSINKNIVLSSNFKLIIILLIDEYNTKNKKLLCNQKLELGQENITRIYTSLDKQDQLDFWNFLNLTFKGRLNFKEVGDQQKVEYCQKFEQSPFMAGLNKMEVKPDQKQKEEESILLFQLTKFDGDFIKKLMGKGQKKQGRKNPRKNNIDKSKKQEQKNKQQFKEDQFQQKNHQNQTMQKPQDIDVQESQFQKKSKKDQPQHQPQQQNSETLCPNEFSSNECQFRKEEEQIPDNQMDIPSDDKYSESYNYNFSLKNSTKKNQDTQSDTDKLDRIVDHQMKYESDQEFKFHSIQSFEKTTNQQLDEQDQCQDETGSVSIFSSSQRKIYQQSQDFDQ